MGPSKNVNQFGQAVWPVIATIYIQTKYIYMSEELIIICTGRAERRFGRTIALSQERSHRSGKNNGTQRTRS